MRQDTPPLHPAASAQSAATDELAQTAEQQNKESLSATTETHSETPLDAAPSSRKRQRITENQAAKEALDCLNFRDAIAHCNAAITENPKDVTAHAMRIMACAFSDCLPHVRQDLITIKRILRDTSQIKDTAQNILTTVTHLHTRLRPMLSVTEAQNIKMRATHTLIEVTQQLVYVATDEIERQYISKTVGANHALESGKYDEAIALSTQAIAIKSSGISGHLIRNAARLLTQNPDLTSPDLASKDLISALQITEEKFSAVEQIQGEDFTTFIDARQREVIHYSYRLRHEAKMKVSKEDVSRPSAAA